MNHPTEQDQPVIRTVALERVYPGAEPVHALRGIDVSIQRGEFVAIMGASGSGKSTLMNILGCLDTPTRGEYWLDQSAMSGLSRDELADLRSRKLGFVFQGFNLLSRTSALDNVLLPLLYDRTGRIANPEARSREVLTRVGLGERLDHVPSQLSGGQQQRVAIARALVNDPTLILADEPTGNLDTRTSIEVMRLFQELNAEGATILLVTHEPHIARYCSRAVELRDGMIIYDAPVADRRDATADLESLQGDTGLESTPSIALGTTHA